MNDHIPASSKTDFYDIFPEETAKNICNQKNFTKNINEIIKDHSFDQVEKCSFNEQTNNFELEISYFNKKENKSTLYIKSISINDLPFINELNKKTLSEIILTKGSVMMLTNYKKDSSSVFRKSGK